MYNKVSPDLNFVQREKKIEEFWKENHIFEKSIEDREGCAAVEYTSDSSLAIKELLISPALLDGAVSLIKEHLQADRYFVRTPALWDGLQGSYIQPFAMVKWLREDLHLAWGEERSGYFGLGFD